MCVCVCAQNYMYININTTYLGVRPSLCIDA